MKKLSEDTRAMIGLAVAVSICLVIIVVLYFFAVAVGVAFDGSIEPRYEMSDTKRRLTLLGFILIGCVMWVIALIPAVLAYRLITTGRIREKKHKKE